METAEDDLGTARGCEMQMQVLEVAIGLFAAFFLVSLIASAFLEVFSNLLKKRSNDLDAVLKDMLGQGVGAIQIESTSVYKAIQAASGRTRRPWSSPTSRKPSYMSARTFADGVIEGLVTLQDAGQTLDDVVGSLPDSLVKQRIMALRSEVGDDLAGVKAGLEGWFDDTMDRLEGAFKRWSQWCLLVIGMVIALVLNVSAVRIGDALWNDAVLRAAVADSVVDLTDRPCPEGGDDCPPEEKIEKAIDDLNGLRLPIGWTEDWSEESGVPGTLLGIVITGLAVVMGAPFWFDLLTRLAGFRGRGVPPRATTDPGSATTEVSRRSDAGSPLLSQRAFTSV